MEPENWWFVDVSPYPRGYFSGSMLILGGVYTIVMVHTPANYNH